MNKALFIGHSLIGTVIPHMFDAFMASIASDIRADAQIINGAPLRYNWDNGATAQGVNARAVLPGGEYGTVIITEAIPLAPQIQWNDSPGYAKRYFDLAVGANAETRFFLYETWHEIGDDVAAWRARIADDASQWQGIIDHVNDNAADGAPTAYVLPAGQAMGALHDRIEAGEVPGVTSITALFSDNIHLNDTGNWFVAALHAAAVTGADVTALPLQTAPPVGAAFGGPDAALAAVMAEVIDETLAATLPQGPTPLVGDDGDNVLAGGAEDNLIEGGAGDDDLSGGAGHDTLRGGPDDDTLEGGADNDALEGGSGFDVARYAGDFADYALQLESGGALTVQSNLPEDLGRDTLTDIEEVHFADGVFAGDNFVADRVEDTGDAYAWQHYTDTFDISGTRTGRVMTYDDGRIAETDYLGGLPSSVLITDAGDAFIWHSVTNAYDATGARIRQTVEYDDGRLLQNDFAQGLRTARSMTDVEDAHAWTSYTDSFDANGLQSSRVMIYDNGKRAETSYDAGLRTSTLNTDLGDAFLWTTLHETFEAGGPRSSQTIHYDDGRLMETLFEGGLRAERSMTDVEDAYGWESYVDTFDAAGVRVSSLFTYDDGSVREFFF